MEYIVSVRLMTYNNSEYIKETMEGVLKQQTNFPVEIVIGDDFSTDNNLDLIKEYKSTENVHIKILDRKVGDEYWTTRQKKGRLYNFINILQNCSGKYIALLDGDDCWTDPLKLQKQVDFMESNPDFSICFHNVLLEYTNSSNENKIFNKLDKDVFTTEDVLGPWFIATASILYRKYDNFILPDWYEKVQSGDIPLLLLLSLYGKIKFLDEVMSIYRLHGTGVSKTHTGNKKIAGIVHIYQSFNVYTDYKYNDFVEKAISYEVIHHSPDYRKSWEENKQLFLETKRLFSENKQLFSENKQLFSEIKELSKKLSLTHTEKKQVIEKLDRTTKEYETFKAEYERTLNNPFRLLKRFFTHNYKKIRRA